MGREDSIPTMKATPLGDGHSKSKFLTFKVGGFQDRLITRLYKMNAHKLQRNYTILY
jgi:hypothetical protein